MSDVGVCAVARGCSSLRHVGVWGCVRLTDLSVRAVAIRSGDGLRFLDVTGCRWVSKNFEEDDTWR